MYHCARYKLKDIMKNRNIHIISMEPVEKKDNETYHIMLEKNYVLTPGSKNGVITINDWNGCIIRTFHEMNKEGLAWLQDTCRDIRIQHDGKILSTTRLETLEIFKKDLSGNIIEFCDGDSEWIINGYILK